MLHYIVRRLLQAIFILFLLSIGLFLLVHLLPGGPEAVIFDPRLSGTARRALAHKYGVDQPLLLQYIFYIRHLFQGDLNSFGSGQPVLIEIGDRIPATLELFGAALSSALVMALLLGVASAVYHYSFTDYIVTIFSYFGIAMPVFWFGLILQQIFSVKFHMLPAFGQESADSIGIGPIGIFSDYLMHLILPALVLSLQFVASWTRYVRSSMLDILNQDYIRTARSKGLRPRLIYFRHALRNALIPFVTVVALDFAGIASGAVITETIFAWPGIGRLFYDSLSSRDYPVLLTMLMLSAATVILVNLLVDIVYGLLDPRIRYS